MARRKMTDAEGRIMEVLWAQSPRTMMEITRALAGETGWSKHTVTTLLKRMLDKGTICMDATGPVRRYAPALTRNDAAAEQVTALVDRMFAGQPAALVDYLIRSGRVTADEARRILDNLT